MSDETKALACAHNGNPAREVSNYTSRTRSALARRRRQVAFLARYRELGVAGKAARESGVPFSTVKKWREEDPVFARHYEDAQEALIARLEDVAIERATVGVETPLVSMGKVVTTVMKSSDDLLKFLLASKKPQEYGRKGQSGVEVGTDEHGRPKIKAYVGIDLDNV